MFGARIDQLPADLAAAGRRRVRVRPRVRQVAADREVVRRVDVVPVRRAGLRGARRDARAALPRAALAAQDQARRLRAARASAPRPAARTSASSRPTRAGTSTSAATAASRRGTRSCWPRTSTPRRWSARSTGSSSTTSAPPTGCSARRRGSRTSRAAWTASGPSSWTTRWASAPTSTRRWHAHVDEYEDEWRATLEDPEKLRRFASLRQRARHPRPVARLRAGARAVPAGDGGRARRRRCAASPSSSPAPPWRSAHDRAGVDPSWTARWTVVCRLDDLAPERGAAALLRRGAGRAVPPRRRPGAGRPAARPVQRRVRDLARASWGRGWSTAPRSRRSPRRCTSRCST